MSNTKKFLSLATVGFTVAAVTATMSSDAFARKKKKEKCYGVAKAGKNDCGDSHGTHSCAAQAPEDAMGSEWIYVPQGLCERLANGSLKPTE